MREEIAVTVILMSFLFLTMSLVTFVDSKKVRGKRNYTRIVSGVAIASIVLFWGINFGSTKFETLKTEYDYEPVSYLYLTPKIEPGSFLPERTAVTVEDRTGYYSRRDGKIEVVTKEDRNSGTTKKQYWNEENCHFVYDCKETEPYVVVHTARVTEQVTNCLFGYSYQTEETVAYQYDLHLYPNLTTAGL